MTLTIADFAEKKDEPVFTCKENKIVHARKAILRNLFRSQEKPGNFYFVGNPALN